MKNLAIIILFALCTNNANAQENTKIVIGTIDSIESKILGEQRKIWVYVPEDRSGGVFTKQRYPVVYLLDGDAHFFSVVGMIQQLSTVNGNMICPEMIVIGIPNTDRTRDLTPSHVNAAPGITDSSMISSTGGGENFTSFIEKELIPHIDSVYPTENYRMFIGHSLGGLMVINTFIKHTSLFNSYVAIDPSMWWDKEKLLNETAAALAENQYANISLFLGIANTMDEGMDTASVKKDTSSNSGHIRAILKLSRYLGANKKNYLNFKYNYYNQEDHGSVPLIAEYDALHFIFNFYRLKLTAADFMDSTDALARKIEVHFGKVSDHFGYNVKPPETLINNMGYQALGAKQMKKAAAFFKLNIDNYPGSYNVYDSMGDFLIAAGDKAAAIASFQKALSLKEFPETRQKLENLQKQQ